MSEENVEIVRKSLNAANAFLGGELSREALAKLGDPQFEFRWHDERTMPDLPQHLQGATEFIEFFELLRSAWDEVTMMPLGLDEVPGDRIVATVRLSFRGRESGVRMVVHFFELLTVRDGKVRKVELFRHRAEAVEAAGLRE
jgi:ketosteroid isomerase-like protein